MELAGDVAELRRAVASILDVVEEMAVAAELGEKPDQEWVSVVQNVFGEHRKALGITGGGEYSDKGHWVRP